VSAGAAVAAVAVAAVAAATGCSPAAGRRAAPARVQRRRPSRKHRGRRRTAAATSTASHAARPCQRRLRPHLLLGHRLLPLHYRHRPLRCLQRRPPLSRYCRCQRLLLLLPLHHHHHHHHPLRRCRRCCWCCPCRRCRPGPQYPHRIQQTRCCCCRPHRRSPLTRRTHGRCHAFETLVVQHQHPQQQ
jgi:hypothetical protein